jgi:hypothetical protein
MCVVGDSVFAAQGAVLLHRCELTCRRMCLQRQGFRDLCEGGTRRDAVSSVG